MSDPLVKNLKASDKAARNGYVQKIQLMQTGELMALLGAIDARTTFGWPQGKAFEYLVVRAFEVEGHKVSYPITVEIRDTVVEEIDGFVSVPGLDFMVESKDQKDGLNVVPIAKLRNQLARRPSGLLGCVFSRSGFTPPAVILSTYCAPQAILLWKWSEIVAAVAEKKMTEALYAKHNVLLRRGIPDWEYAKSEEQ
jgi:hypothetical protein